MISCWVLSSPDSPKARTLCEKRVASLLIISSPTITADALGPVGLNAGLRVGVTDGMRVQLDDPGDAHIRSCLLNTLELRVKRPIDSRQFREQGILALKGVVALERRLAVCIVHARIA